MTMNGTISYRFHGRYFICVLAACVLTGGLAGGMGEVSAPAAQRPALLQA